MLLVDKWGERRMREQLVGTTVHYIKVMLASSKLKTVTSERTLLKNLGAWLGKLTLANNRPVLQARGRLPREGDAGRLGRRPGDGGVRQQRRGRPASSGQHCSRPPCVPCSLLAPPQKHLDVKSIILTAYEKGMMLAVLSFVRMLLEPAMDSRVFRPPNPWVMAILALLVEVRAGLAPAGGCRGVGAGLRAKDAARSGDGHSTARGCMPTRRPHPQHCTAPTAPAPHPPARCTTWTTSRRGSSLRWSCCSKA